MNNQEIVGMNSAYEHAKQCAYGANMSISAALVVDMAKRIAELERERFALLSCLLGISNECIGEIAMNYKLDAQMIGESIYAATGLSNPELAKALKEKG